MEFIDTHCHFDFPPFTEHEGQSLVQTFIAGVTNMIVPAITLEKFENICCLVERYPSIYAALGLHPIYQHAPTALAQLRKYLSLKHPKFVAIGEIGLDLYVQTLSISQQLSLLRAQFNLAAEFDLPVILHSRKTHDILYKELKQTKLPKKGVIHGFSGNLEQAMRFVTLGYYIGVGGVISYQRANKTRNTISALPLSSLLLETDSPYMPLHGFQGQANRPERIKAIFQILCSIREESPQQIAQVIYQNSRKLFTIQ